MLSQIRQSTKARYEKKYADFRTWLRERSLEITEDSLLLYFYDRNFHIKSSSSFWVEFASLKQTILLYDNIDISQYKQVIDYIKSKKSEDCPKTSEVFTRTQINKFLVEAPDNAYLMMKVAAIIGLVGGCGRDELFNMSINDFEDRGSVMIVTIPGKRMFTIIDQPYEEVQLLPLIRKYINLRPQDPSLSRFFYTVRKGECHNPAGLHAVKAIPRKIAEFLQLENPQAYTGKAFQKSSLVWQKSKLKF